MDDSSALSFVSIAVGVYDTVVATVLRHFMKRSASAQM